MYICVCTCAAGIKTINFTWKTLQNVQKYVRFQTTATKYPLTSYTRHTKNEFIE